MRDRENKLAEEIVTLRISSDVLVEKEKSDLDEITITRLIQSLIDKKEFPHIKELIKIIVAVDMLEAFEIKTLDALLFKFCKLFDITPPPQNLLAVEKRWVDAALLFSLALCCVAQLDSAQLKALTDNSIRAPILYCLQVTVICLNENKAVKERKIHDVTPQSVEVAPTSQEFVKRLENVWRSYYITQNIKSPRMVSLRRRPSAADTSLFNLSISPTLFGLVRTLTGNSTSPRQVEGGNNSPRAKEGDSNKVSPRPLPDEGLAESPQDSPRETNSLPTSTDSITNASPKENTSVLIPRSKSSSNDLSVSSISPRGNNASFSSRSNSRRPSVSKTVTPRSSSLDTGSDTSPQNSPRDNSLINVLSHFHKCLAPENNSAPKMSR